ncbi:hypothetical protein [Paenibacillus tundrae]
MSKHVRYTGINIQLPQNDKAIYGINNQGDIPLGLSAILNVLFP